MTAAERSTRTPAVPVGVMVLTLTYLVAAIIGALATGNGEFVFYIGVMVVLIGAILVAHRRIRLSDGRAVGAEPVGTAAHGGRAGAGACVVADPW